MCPLFAPPLEATQGGDCFPREDPIVFHHLIYYKRSGKSLKRIKEDRDQFLRGKFPFPYSPRRARFSSIKTYQKLLFHENYFSSNWFRMQLWLYVLVVENELTDLLQWWVILLGSNPDFSTTLLKRLVKSLRGFTFWKKKKHRDKIALS